MLAICTLEKFCRQAVFMLRTLRTSLQEINTGFPLRYKRLARHAPVSKYQPSCSVSVCGKLAGHMRR